MSRRVLLEAAAQAPRRATAQSPRRATAQAPLDGKVERCVEALCEQGCATVNQYIEALQIGRQLPGIDTLDVTERRALLEELVSIMRVYQDSCDSE